MRAALRRGSSLVQSAALTTAAVLGTACLLATVVAPLAGIRPLIFLSGSMSPTIPAGSLALAQRVEAAEVAINDIVTVRSNGAYMTHRVVDVTHAPGRATLLLRGDGNKAVDPTLYEVTSVPRTEIWVPHAGTVVAWFSRAPGVYVLAGWVALVLGMVRRHRSGSRGGYLPPPSSTTGPPKLVLLVNRAVGRGSAQVAGRPDSRAARRTRVAAFATLLIAGPTPAFAAWGDGVQVAGTSIQAVTPAPTVVTCTDLGTTVRLSWTAIAGATHYRVSYGGLGADRVESQTVLASDPLFRDFDSAREGRFDVYVRFGSDSWLSIRSNQVSYTKGNCG